MNQKQLKRQFEKYVRDRTPNISVRRADSNLGGDFVEFQKSSQSTRVPIVAIQVSNSIFVN